MEAADGALLDVGAELAIGGRRVVVERRAGTEARPLVRLSGVGDRSAAEALRGQELLGPPDEAAEPVEGEWDVADLIGCEVPGVGRVRRVVAAPSCDVLEVGEEGVLVPFVSDAVRRVDPAAGVIEVDLRFLGLEGTAP